MDQKADTPARPADANGSLQGWPRAAVRWLRTLGLSAKLLLLTTTFVMLAEVLIFVPSVANFWKLLLAVLKAV